MSNTSDSSPRKLKILMLHGYTQSGPLFHAKTRALEKILAKAFPASSPSSPLPTYPGGIQLIYPTGPLNLRAADIPGYTPSSSFSTEIETESEAWAWWRKNDSTGEYTGLLAGLARIAETIREAGGVDGVIGFSQGAAAAVLVASLLDEGRLQSWNEYQKEHPSLSVLPYPKSFLLENTSTSDTKVEPKTFHPPLKFAISYSGFYAPHAAYTPFYVPRIQTRVLHVIGTLDSVVEEGRSLKSAEVCDGWGKGKENVVYHAGGHFVPIGKEMAGVVVGFIKDTCGEGKSGKDKKGEEVGVEDMEMPF